jgi:magnesium transporter
MITCRTYRNGGLEGERPFDPTADELEELRRTFGLHPLALEDSRNWGQRAKLEFYTEAGHLFVVARALPMDERGQVVDREVHLFVGQRSYLITVRREPAFDLVLYVLFKRRDWL